MPRSPKSEDLVVQTINIIRVGETPFDFAEEPQVLPGPWTGQTVEAILRTAKLDPNRFEWWDPELNYDEEWEIWAAPLPHATVNDAIRESEDLGGTRVTIAWTKDREAELLARVDTEELTSWAENGVRIINAKRYSREPWNVQIGHGPAHAVEQWLQKTAVSWTQADAPRGLRRYWTRVATSAKIVDRDGVPVPPFQWSAQRPIYGSHDGRWWFIGEYTNEKEARPVVMGLVDAEDEDAAREMAERVFGARRNTIQSLNPKPHNFMPAADRFPPHLPGGEQSEIGAHVAGRINRARL